MQELEIIIRDEISERGPITFARFMELALYHPAHGYYTSGRAAIGRSGDFYTSPHTGPLFGRLIADIYLKLNSTIGGGCSFVEMGAGEGWLARDFIESLDAAPGNQSHSVDYIIVERSLMLREKQARRLGPLASRVKWCSSMEELPEGICGVFFSNELVDALPFHRVRQDPDGIKEVFVTCQKDGFREATGTVSTPELPRYLNRLSQRLERGQTTEIRLEANRWMKAVAGKLAKGYVITVDYGYTASEYFAPERENGTLMCYRGHTAGENPYEHIGEQDITAHVEFTTLCQQGAEFGLKPVLFTDQGSFLLDAACRVEARLRASGAPQEELDRLGSGLKPLVHPEWMGGAFRVLVQARDAATDGLFGDVKNELDRLCKCGGVDSFAIS